MAEHTPGPWIPSIHGFNVVTADSMFSICAVHDIHAIRANEIGHEAARLELRANSHLIAAAPDLLAACEMVPRLLKEIRGFASDVFGGESSLTDCLDLVLSETGAAIAKARG